MGTKLLSSNKRRIPKEWKKNGNAGSVTFRQFKTRAEEDDYVSRKIAEIRATEPQASILILSPLRLIVDGLREKFGEENPEVVDCWVQADVDRQQRIWWLCAIFLEDKLKFVLFLLGMRRLARNDKLISILKEHLEKGGNSADTVAAILKLKVLPKPFTNYLETVPELDKFFTDHPEFEDLREHLDCRETRKEP